MVRRWSLPNLLAMCDTCLGELIEDMGTGKVEEAMAKAERMKRSIVRLKTHCGECDERIIEEI